MELLNTKQAAERLGISPQRVGQLIKAGKLRATKVGRDHVIRKIEITRFSAIERKNGRPASR